MSSKGRIRKRGEKFLVQTKIDSKGVHRWKRKGDQKKGFVERENRAQRL